MSNPSPPTPPRPQEIIRKLCFWFVICNSIVNNSVKSSEKRKQELVQCNTDFRKKQDPLKIELACEVVNYKDIQKVSFLSIFKISQIRLKDVQTRRK